jgi:hypothetical protein
MSLSGLKRQTGAAVAMRKLDPVGGSQLFTLQVSYPVVFPHPKTAKRRKNRF